MIYINSLIVSIIINLIFYSDKTMHKLYKENEENKYNFIFRLPIIFISNFVYKFITILFDKIINFQDDFIKLKRNLAKEKKEQANIIKKSFKQNLYIFYTIIILINIFSWYYISCFSAVYKITQKYLFIDFLYNRSIDLINCLVSSLFYFIIMITIIRGNYSFCKKFIKKIVDNDFAKFFIEVLIGGIIIEIIKLIHPYIQLIEQLLIIIYLIIIIIILIIK